MAQQRKRIPFWAMPVLVALPLWAYTYQATLEPPPSHEMTPVEQGGVVYKTAGCVSCHLANGSGSASVPRVPRKARGVWPDFRDHMLWVRLGNGGWFEATSSGAYGADDRQTNGGFMPPFVSLTDEQLAQVVLYERVTFGGLEEGEVEYELLLRIAEGETTFSREAGSAKVATAKGMDSALLSSG